MSPANEVAIVILDEEPPPGIAAFRRSCHRLLAAAGIKGAEVSVLLTGDRRMRELNRRYRRVDRTTDVLSFSQDLSAADRPETGRSRALGDIVISLPAAGRNAARFGVSTEQELQRLAAHGLLHLAGWDHRSAAARARMAARQEELVAAMERKT
jgi:probable rRNA maturation factor